MREQMGQVAAEDPAEGSVHHGHGGELRRHEGADARGDGGHVHPPGQREGVGHHQHRQRYGTKAEDHDKHRKQGGEPAVSAPPAVVKLVVRHEAGGTACVATRCHDGPLLRGAGVLRPANLRLLGPWGLRSGDPPALGLARVRRLRGLAHVAPVGGRTTELRLVLVVFPRHYAPASIFSDSSSHSSSSRGIFLESAWYSFMASSNLAESLYSSSDAMSFMSSS